MDVLQVRWTGIALPDLKAQLEYLARENPDAAGPHRRADRATMDSFGTFPQVGCDGVVAGSRQLVIPNLPCVCVYRINNGRIERLRLLHERLQWPR